MKYISRYTFLKRSFNLGGLSLLSPIADSILLNHGNSNVQNNRGTEDILSRLVKANDAEVAKLLGAPAQDMLRRKLGFDFATLSASFCAKSSTYYQEPLIIPGLEKIAELLLSFQAADGTVSIGNLESPPDTAFLLEPLCSAVQILKENKSKALDNAIEKMIRFILNAGKALTTGGVHTPNHRWVISAALAQINHLNPDKKYVARIDDWLGEGIFIDSDGHYPERSMTYSFVENKAFLTMGHLLSRPSLFEPVRKNLEMTYYYMEPDGDLVTTDSRRQDQYGSKNIVSWYLLYRYMAIKDKNGRFAAIARLIENHKEFDEVILSQSLFHFLETPLLQQELPAQTQLPVEFDKLFTTTNLARMRKGDNTVTLFGGVDWPLIIASGRSNSPNIFSLRKGKAVLKYLRLSTDFFSTGYFYSDGLKKQKGKYFLHKKLEAPYYQPLAKDKRNTQGDYTLSPSTDGRFWNKMDFEDRPVSNVKTLETKISFSESNARNVLNFSVSGMKGVAVTIELCFKEGGRLSGVTGVTGVNDPSQNHFLANGEGKYEYDGDTIHFGPGIVAGKKINNLEGERYSTHFGSLRTEGLHVFFTGITPFEHQLSFY